MLSRVLPSLALLLAASAAHAATVAGAVERLDALGTSGWACTLDGSSTPNIAAYAGGLLIGVYAPTKPRPEMNGSCRKGQASGFDIAFDPSAQASFAWQNSLSIYGVAPMAVPLLIPGASKSIVNPLPLPVGALSGMTSSGMVTGSVSGKGSPPSVQLYTNGPAGWGNAGDPSPTMAAAGGGFGFQLAAPASKATTVLTPIYGAVALPGGAAVPLVSPLALATDAGGNTQNPATIQLNGTVAQRGSMSGITTTIYSSWMPAGYGLAGVSGNVGFYGNGSGFSEALVLVGFTADDQPTCAQENGVTMANPPTITRFWAEILKTNGTAAVSQPVNFAVPYPLAAAHATTSGTCVVAMVAAGYVFLDSVSSRYTTTNMALNVMAVPLRKYTPGIIPFGMGGEFRIPTTTGGPSLSAYIGIMATKPLALDGLAGSVSAGAVTGAPANSQWVPAPPGVWQMGTDTYYMPASVCASAGLKTQGSNGTFAVIRNGTAAPVTLPDGAVPMMAMPISSLTTQAVQRALYQPYIPGNLPSGFTGRMAPGDCLVTLETATGNTGVLDVENQSTIYLRVVQ